MEHHQNGHANDELPRIRKLFIECSKKDTKSTQAAADAQEREEIRRCVVGCCREK